MAHPDDRQAAVIPSTTEAAAMAAEGNEQQQDDQGQEQDQDTWTPERGKAVEEALKKERANGLRKSRRIEEFEAKEREREEDARRKAQAGLGEPEKLAGRLREVETESQSKDQKIASLAADNARLRQDLTLAGSVGKFVDPEFHDWAIEKLDRDLLDVDESGRITGGIDRAFQALLKAKPKIGIPKKPDGGTPPPRGQSRGNGQQADPVGQLLGKSTSLGT